MNFTSAIQTCLNKYATFSGRAARPEFWWFVLFGCLVNIAAGILDSALFGHGPHLAQPITALTSLGLLLPNLAVSARRLHDIGRSGWWVLIGLIPVLGILLLIWWWTRPSQPAA
ncbi:MAG: DUF805 domain-containing protein [Rhodobacteraceae bacterium]|nr:DUF805 domain-containing protein [Paracoccaceae bacterium]